MKLTDKLTTEEMVRAATRAYVYSEASNGIQSQFNRLGNRNLFPSYWAVREQLRIESGIHEVSEVLAKINCMFPVFAHVCKTDKQMIAYTPDRNCGLADRQITIAAGRFFSKMLPLFNDELIAELTSDHLAEIAQDVEFITGEEIAKAYATFPSGVAACMTKTWAISPLLVYDAPNIAMAVLRRGKEISARTMVYTPTDTDKRIIRLYGGDRLKLQKILEKKGYRIGSWQGATLRLVKKAGEDNIYAAPYLDSMGGYTNPSTCSLAIFDETLHVLTEQGKARMDALDLETSLGGSSGFAQIPRYSTAELNQKDLITGEDINLITTDQITNPIWVDGVEGYTVKPAYDLLENGYTRGCTTWGSNKLVFMPKSKTYQHNSKTVLDTDDNRNLCGYIKFKDTPEAEEVWTLKAKLRNLGTTEVPEWVRDENLVFLRTDGEFKMVRKTEITKKHIKLHTDVECAREGYLCKGDKFFTTGKGRKVHPEYNRNIRLMVDGNYEFLRNIKYQIVHFDGHKFALSFAHYQENAGRVAKEREEAMMTAPVDQFFSWFRHNLGYLLAVEGGKYLTHSTYLGNLPKTADCVMEVVESTRSRNMADPFRDAIRTYERWYAEANAVCEPIRVAEEVATETPEQVWERVDVLPVGEIPEQVWERVEALPVGILPEPAWVPIATVAEQAIAETDWVPEPAPAQSLPEVVVPSPVIISAISDERYALTA